MTGDQDFPNLVGSIYQAAVEPNSWSTVLDQASRFFNIPTAALWVANGATIELEFAHNKDPLAIHLFKQHYMQLLPQWFWQAPLGSVIGVEAAPSVSSWTNTEFFCDWSHRFGYEKHLSAFVGQSGGSEARLFLAQPQRAPDIEDGTRTRVASLIPHFQRALEVHQCFQRLRNQNDILELALEAIPLGLVLVGPNCKVFFANREARRIASDKDGFEIKNGNPQATRTSCASHLRTIVAQAVRTGIGQGLKNGGAMSLPRRSHKPDYTVIVSPMVRFNNRNLGSNTCAALLIISDPVRTSSTVAEFLRLLYRLSPREAEVAMLLANGTRQHDLGEELGVSRETIRTFVKRIYAKTGANNQITLARLVNNGPAAYADALRKSLTEKGPRTSMF